ncbi:hypothetical protein C7H85_02070 [Zobellella endophytica]|uniref:EamA domain-containing protein n=1 Tax=Zobellella endophytica TaxID=2116700 RepID=A0A2P7RBU0_9GAMM|nr:DMT family transporter [Zobellella endophytica]PSJ47640.1 hypothetical protein C7H85_02070 [Zobellella endophytica]
MLYSVLCATLWASTGLFVKLFQGLGMSQVIWGRFLVALACGWLFVVLTRRARPARLPLGRRYGLAAAMTAYYVLATYAFYYAPVGVAALLIALAPLFTFLLKLIATRRYQANEAAGFALSFAGLLLYFGSQNGGAGEVPATLWLGGLCGLGAAMLRALFTYVAWKNARQGKPMDSFHTSNDIFVLGLVLLLPVVLAQPLSAQSLSPANLACLLGLGVVATFLPNIFNNLASLRLDPTLHNIIGMSTPISASLMAWIWLDEAQSTGALLGMAITLAGIGGSIWRPRRRPS